jgi:hypothetical protein
MLGKFIAGDFIAIAGEMRRFPASNENTELLVHNAQDFAQILHFVGGVRIINRNNVLHSFPDREITCPPYFCVYYCQHAKLNIS